MNGGELAPWERTGPGKANDGGPKYDLNRFDERYWRRAVQYVQDATQRGIYPLIQIWCEPLVERGEGRWIVHPFDPDNNINHIPKLPTGSADAGRDGIFYNTANRRLLRFQEAFVRKALDELGRFPVIWDIGSAKLRCQMPASTQLATQPCTQPNGTSAGHWILTATLPRTSGSGPARCCTLRLT